MSETGISQRGLEIVETVNEWCIQAIDHVEDPGETPVTDEFRDRTDKLLDWCVEFHIDPKPIWETYCQAVAARGLTNGAFGPRRSQRNMEKTYRGAILSCNLLRACAKAPADAKVEAIAAESNDPGDFKWSEAKPPSEWRKTLKMSQTTLKRRKDDGTLVVDAITSKSWRIRLDTLDKFLGTK